MKRLLFVPLFLFVLLTHISFAQNGSKSWTFSKGNKSKVHILEQGQEIRVKWKNNFLGNVAFGKLADINSEHLVLESEGKMNEIPKKDITEIKSANIRNDDLQLWSMVLLGFGIAGLCIGALLSLVLYNNALDSGPHPPPLGPGPGLIIVGGCLVLIGTFCQIRANRHVHTHHPFGGAWEIVESSGNENQGP